MARFVVLDLAEQRVLLVDDAGFGCGTVLAWSFVVVIARSVRHPHSYPDRAGTIHPGDPARRGGNRPPTISAGAQGVDAGVARWAGRPDWARTPEPHPITRQGRIHRRSGVLWSDTEPIRRGVRPGTLEQHAVSLADTHMVVDRSHRVVSIVERLDDNARACCETTRR